MRELKTLKELRQEYEDELTLHGELDPLVDYKCTNCGSSNAEFGRETEWFFEHMKREGQKIVDWLDKPDDAVLLEEIFGEEEPPTTMRIGGMKILEYFLNLVKK